MNKQGPGGIAWCDYTWSPITGCSPASEACFRCYAAALSKRFGWSWGHPVFHPDRLDEPSKVKKPSRVFVCSMSDLWHEEVSRKQRDDIYCAMLKAPWHTYLLLTKRPQNWLQVQVGFPENWWLGVTAENQTRYDERFAFLCHLPCLRFLSVEPMLGPVTVENFSPGPDWVIAGPETGPGARPCDPAWIQSLANECAVLKIPFFDKRKHFIRREFPAERGQR